MRSQILSYRVLLLLPPLHSLPWGSRLSRDGLFRHVLLPWLLDYCIASWLIAREFSCAVTLRSVGFSVLGIVRLYYSASQ